MILKETVHNTQHDAGKKLPSKKNNETGRVDIGMLLASLKECTRSKNIQRGKYLHSQAVRSDDFSDRYAANSLITMYSSCGSMLQARLVFDLMLLPDVVSWTALLQGYARNSECELALELFYGTMQQSSGCIPNAKTFVAVLSACISLAASENCEKRRRSWLEKGEQLHARALAYGCCDLFVENLLLDMYSRFGNVSQSRSIFECMVRRDIVSWNTLIQGCVENSENELALEIFDEMERESGVVPDARTYLAAITACSNLSEKDVDGRWLSKGERIHSRAVKNRCCDIFVETALVIMYSRFKRIVEARGVFDKIARRDIVSWNAMLQGYVDNDQSEVALELFDGMGDDPNPRTYLVAVSACTALASQQENILKWLEKGKRIHARALKSGSCNTYVQTGLITMYSGFGAMDLAEQVFNTSEKSLVFWNSLIQGYIDNEEHKLAIQTTALMDLNGISLDSVTFVAALKACGALVSSQDGELFHQEITQRSDVQENLRVLNCLLDFYSKCGKMEMADEMFSAIKQKDAVSWNSLMAGYSAQGYTEKVLEIFEKMKEQGVAADEVTFSCLFIACSHSGLTDKAKELFDSMSREHGLRPGLKHYTGLVDVYGRANRVQEALELVQQMPFKGNDVIWCTLLSACEKWNNVGVGQVAYEALLELNKLDSSAYVLMANLYKANGLKGKYEEMLASQQKLKQV